MKKAVNPIIRNDILRYKKNKLGSSLALLGIVFCCVYFISLYSQIENNDFYYKWSLAFDIIYNLFFMLFIFLFSEQVKNYERKGFIPQLIFGALQFARIFWLPLSGLTHNAITITTFIVMLVGLAGSGLCIIASAIIGFMRSKAVENFSKKVENGEISVDAELKRLDAEQDALGGKINA